MTEQAVAPDITDEAIWETALAVLAEAPEENEYLDVKTLAQMTSEAFGFVGEKEPKTSRVASLLRVELSHFQKQHPDLLTRRRPPHGDYGIAHQFTEYLNSDPRLVDCRTNRKRCQV